MSNRERTAKKRGGQAPVPRTPPGAEQEELQQALRRLTYLNEISKLLTRFESVEKTVPTVLDLLTRAVALRSVIFLTRSSLPSSPIVWQADGNGETRLRLAKLHASNAFEYLVRQGSHSTGSAPALEAIARAADEPVQALAGSGNFIVLPLVVAGRPIFGALQIEGAGPLDELDLVFTNAMVNQLAIAIDRIEVVEARQAESELRRVAAEGREALASLHESDARRTVKEQLKMLGQSERLAGIGRLAAGIAHEINNPIGVILGYVRILRKNANEELDSDLKIIEDEAVRCKEIVQGLLDLSRPIKVEVQPADLMTIAEEAVAWLRDALLIEGVDISVEGSGVAIGSPQKIWQVVTNLLKNGAEAAGAGGKVRVRVSSSEEGFVQMTVDDNGPGLPTGEMQDMLFEPFFSTKASGTGLGLAVSRTIVQAHGGTLEGVTSPSGGASFTVRLPLWTDES